LHRTLHLQTQISRRLRAVRIAQAVKVRDRVLTRVGRKRRQRRVGFVAAEKLSAETALELLERMVTFTEVHLGIAGAALRDDCAKVRQRKAGALDWQDGCHLCLSLSTAFDEFGQPGVYGYVELPATVYADILPDVESRRTWIQAFRSLQGSDQKAFT